MAPAHAGPANLNVGCEDSPKQPSHWVLLLRGSPPQLLVGTMHSIMKELCEYGNTHSPVEKEGHAGTSKITHLAPFTLFRLNSLGMTIFYQIRLSEGCAIKPSPIP